MTQPTTHNEGRQRLKRPRVRLFVALELPDTVRKRLAGWQGKTLAEIEGLRLLAPENLHCTLVFLGYQYEKSIDRIAAATFDAVGGARPLTLNLGEVKAVPRSNPRLFAVDLEGEAEELKALQAAISRRLAAMRLYTPEKRPFWPHVTVARVRRRRRRRKGSGEAPPEPFRGTPPQLPQGQKAPFRGVRLTLYRSVLKQTGAIYEPLAQHELGG